MADIKIKGVKIVRPKLADGSRGTYFYHRATGARLPSDPNSTAFRIVLESLNRQAQAERASRTDLPTIGSLIRAYQAAPDWTDLATSTREIEQFNINAIEREFGSMPLAEAGGDLAREAFSRWHAERAIGHPRDADARLSRFSRILTFAVNSGVLAHHPLPTFKRAYSKPLQAPPPLPTPQAAAPALNPAGQLGPSPRLLSKAQAAHYLGLTLRGFDRWRKEGKVPQPLPGTARWDKVAIDLALDALSNLTKASAPPPEAPFDMTLAGWTKWRDEKRMTEGRQAYRSPKEIRDAAKKKR